MIVEGLVTTTDDSGRLHLAPMGPIVRGDFAELLFRPFPSSQTYQHLASRPEGVFHVTDDASLIARAALGKADPPAARLAEAVKGFVLEDCCRAYEFHIVKVDATGERIAMTAEVLKTHRIRDFLGFNRAKHAVIEAAILMTRRHLIPRVEIEAELARFAVIVAKTGGDAEREAMEFLRAELDGGAP